MWALILVAVVLTISIILFLVGAFNFKSVRKMFKNGNVCVTGLRGTGKDMLFGNVIARDKQDYVSNLDYTNGKYFMPLVLSNLNINNNYDNFINNKINHYDFSDYYKSGADIYISDAGVYFPSHYCNELNKKYSTYPNYMALSRQISHNNIHVNVQNLNRCWDKIREQSDIYIRCRKCVVIGPLVIQLITIYDKYESCLNRINPCRISVPLLADSITKMNAKLYLDNFYNQHGKVINETLIYINKSKHDTYYFEKLLKGDA